MIENNAVLLDQAWTIANILCDPTCPPEIVREKAQQIFDYLLITL